jgi:hypothetical protein
LSRIGEAAPYVPNASPALNTSFDVTLVDIEELLRSA